MKIKKLLTNLFKDPTSPRHVILKHLREEVLPSVSKTEREALESGTVGWEGELINGSPDWSKLSKYKKPELTAREQAFLDGPVEELCHKLDRWEIRENKDLSPEAWKHIRDGGFMGLEVKEEYGGHGFSKQLHSAVVMKTASRSVDGAVTVMVPNSLGPAELITHYGTDKQKKELLPLLANGTHIPCFGLTEPNAGSDAGAIDAKGTLFKDKGGNLKIRMSFGKRYITLAPVATLAGLAFKLEDPDNLLGKGKDLGITVALVPTDTEGVKAGARHQPMNLSFMNGTLEGKDVVISADNIIGGTAQAGKGWKMLMESLSVGRSLSLPALATAGAKLSTAVTTAYAATRRQFGVAIGGFQAVEYKIGEMAAETYVMDAARASTIQMVQEGERPAVPSAILKYHLVEKMRKIVNDAVDILGGKAVMNGPKNLLTDMYDGVPVASTVEGANIMTRGLIINGQGLVRANKYLLKIMDAAHNPDEKQGFKGVNKYTGAILLQTLTSGVKAAVFGVTNGRGSLSLSKAGVAVDAAFHRLMHKKQGEGRLSAVQVVKSIVQEVRERLDAQPKMDPATKKYYRAINRLSAAFNFVANPSAMILGGRMKMEENLSGRLGDVTSNLYLASVALDQHVKRGAPQDDLPLLHLGVSKALFNAEEALDKALANHPVKILGKLLRPIVLPLGRRIAEPSDEMVKAAADVVMKPTQARERLISGIFLPKAENEQIGLLEASFRVAAEAADIEKKMSDVHRASRKSGHTKEEAKQAAEKILTWDDRQVLNQAAELRQKVVAVDVFQPKK